MIDVTEGTPIQDLLGAFLAIVGLAFLAFSTPMGRLIGIGLIIAGVIAIQGDLS